MASCTPFGPAGLQFVPMLPVLVVYPRFSYSIDGHCDFMWRPQQGYPNMDGFPNRSDAHLHPGTGRYCLWWSTRAHQHVPVTLR